MSGLHFCILIFQGCYDKFLEVASENLNILFGSLVGLGAVQFVAIVFAFCICKVGWNVPREGERVLENICFKWRGP